MNQYMACVWTYYGLCMVLFYSARQELFKSYLACSSAYSSLQSDILLKMERSDELLVEQGNAHWCIIVGYILPRRYIGGYIL